MYVRGKMTNVDDREDNNILTVYKKNYTQRPAASRKTIICLMAR